MSVQAVSIQAPPPAIPAAKQASPEIAASQVAVAPKTEVTKVEANNPQQIEEAVKAVQKFVQPMASNLQFTIDEETGIKVVKVIDTATKDVIRQFPSEEILQIAKALDKLQGILIEQKA
jgi:flagellar protein FlaG